MSDKNKNLIEDAKGYAGEDQYPGAILLREISSALEEVEQKLSRLRSEIGEPEEHYQEWHSTADEVWGGRGFCAVCQTMWPCQIQKILDII